MLETLVIIALGGSVASLIEAQAAEESISSTPGINMDWLDVVLLAAGVVVVAGGLMGLIGTAWALGEHFYREWREEQQ